MMNFTRSAVGIAAGIALSAGMIAAGGAATPSDQIATYQGREFVCTGIGDQAQNNPEWDRFPLKMVFTNVDGDYLGDVSVKLTDDNGDVTIAADCSAPWFLADIDAGHYTAKVVARGRYEQTVSVQVKDQGQTQVVVPFNQITDS